MSDHIDKLSEKSWYNYVKKNGMHLPGPSSLFEHGFMYGVEAALKSKSINPYLALKPEKLKWVNRGQGNIWELRETCICVHKHIDYPSDQWLLSWSYRGLTRIRLNSKDIEIAKDEAIKYCFDKLWNDIQSLRGICE